MLVGIKSSLVYLLELTVAGACCCCSASAAATPPRSRSNDRLPGAPKDACRCWKRHSDGACAHEVRSAGARCCCMWAGIAGHADSAAAASIAAAAVSRALVNSDAGSAESSAGGNLRNETAQSVHPVSSRTAQLGTRAPTPQCPMASQATAGFHASGGRAMLRRSMKAHPVHPGRQSFGCSSTATAAEGMSCEAPGQGFARPEEGADERRVVINGRLVTTEWSDVKRRMQQIPEGLDPAAHRSLSNARTRLNLTLRYSPAR